MAEPNWVALNSLRGTVTESAANTFTQTTINTNLSLEARTIIIVPEVFLNYATSVDEDGGVRIQLSTASQTALIDYDDPHCVVRVTRKQTAYGTAGNTTIQDHGMHIRFAQALPLAVPQLFIAVQGQNMTAQQQVTVRIPYWSKKVSESVFFRVANSC